MTYIINFLKTYILNKSFFFGTIICFGIFSKYIFGPNNLAEEIAEVAYYVSFGKEINFSDEPETSEESKALDETVKFMMINSK